VPRFRRQHAQDGLGPAEGSTVQPSCRPGPASGFKERKLGAPMWRRFSGNAIAFNGLSALTQLTRLATDYAGSTQREALYSQLAQLTGLRELDAPMALQTDGVEAMPATSLHSS
jgi:hypothetical protein